MDDKRIYVFLFLCVLAALVVSQLGFNIYEIFVPKRDCMDVFGLEICK